MYLAVLLALLQGVSMRGAKMLVSLSALEMGATPFQVGLLAALFAAFPLALAVYAGKISDRIGVKRPIAGGAVMLALALLTPCIVTQGSRRRHRRATGGRRMNRVIAIVVACIAVAAHAQAPKGDAARGKAAFMKNMCYTCHGTVGQGGDRGSGPRIAYDVWPWEGFVQQVRHPREQMPRYTKEHVSDEELADIYAYVASHKRGPKASEIPLLKE